MEERTRWIAGERAATWKRCNKPKRIKRRSRDSLNRLLRFLDADKDGLITPNDAKTAFKKSDRDRDTFLTTREIQRSTKSIF
jgi:Ca2+-binding EF-hand superfamily protein